MEKDKRINGCKLLILGGSAGSLEVLIKILPHLTVLSGYAMVIVLHRKGSEDNTLEELIAIKTTVPVVEVEDKTPLVPGHIYVAPSDYHLLFEKNDTISLDTSEKVNYSRPSIDVSFESAADIYGASLVAILLSGANADGTNGLISVKNAGGTVIIQDPVSAEVSFMPGNALDNMKAHFVADVKKILELILSINID
jgi:two-component system chemotaxis response regulator CheB